MLAWALADVLGGNPHPPIALGRRDHGLEQPAIRLLDLATPTELRLSLAEPDREPVADPLELGDTKNARPADSGHIPMDPRSREGRCEELASRFSSSAICRRSSWRAWRSAAGWTTGSKEVGSGAPTGSSNAGDSISSNCSGNEAPPSALNGPQQSNPVPAGDPALSAPSIECGIGDTYGPQSFTRSLVGPWGALLGCPLFGPLAGPGAPLPPHDGRRQPHRLLHGYVRDALDLDRCEDHPRGLGVHAAAGSGRSEQKRKGADLVGDDEGARRERPRAALQPLPFGALADAEASLGAVGVEGAKGHDGLDDRDRQRVVEEALADEATPLDPLQGDRLDRRWLLVRIQSDLAKEHPVRPWDRLVAQGDRLRAREAVGQLREAVLHVAGAAARPALDQQVAQTESRKLLAKLGGDPTRLGDGVRPHQRSSLARARDSCSSRVT